MRILGIDLETTGLEAKKDFITEVGLAVYDTDLKRITYAHSHFIVLPKGVEIPPFIVNLTGLTTEVVNKHGIDSIQESLSLAHTISLGCDFAMAHNAHGFEIPWLAHHSNPEDQISIPWIDSSLDIPYPEGMSTRKLVHLAAEHYVPLRAAHGALEDVLTMFEILKKYNWEVVKAFALSPNVEAVAKVDFQQKEFAKSRGYRWSPERKVWAKRMKQCEVERQLSPAQVGEHRFFVDKEHAFQVSVVSV